MSTDTPHLGMPLIDASQSQKHVTHNAALALLDAIVQLSVIDATHVAPPVGPTEGDRYLVASGGSGTWAGWDLNIAHYTNGAWTKIAPKPGWLVYNQMTKIVKAWDGSGWIDFAVTLASLADGTVKKIGINTAADDTNRLALKSDGVLFSHDDVTPGTGSIQHKLNKKDSGHTASFLFQDNWSGRAEIGLTGDDDFHFKVSGDGSTWFEGIKIDRNNGRVSFPVSGGPREVLSADRTYYVRTDGSDSNDGKANTAGGAWLTLQHAADVVFGTIDLGGHNVTVQIADGTYTEGVAVVGAQVGAGRIYFVGNSGTPGNVIVTSGTHYTFKAEAEAFFTVQSMEIRSTSNGCLQATKGAKIYFSNLRIGSTVQHQIRADDQGLIFCEGNYSIVASSGQAHWSTIAGGVIRVQTKTITLVGTPNFPSGFASAWINSMQVVNGNTFSGSGTGSRYDVQSNAVVYSTGGAIYLPGDSAGTTASGGQYV